MDKLSMFLSASAFGALALGAAPRVRDAQPLTTAPAAAWANAPNASAKESVLDYAAVGFSPRSEEHAAIGPDLLAAGPRKALALYDPIGHRVLMVRKEKIEATFYVARADDLAFSSDGSLLVLDESDHAVLHYANQQLVERARLPDLAPQGGSLKVELDAVYSEDAFGNLHPIARLSTKGFVPLGGPSLVPTRHPVRAFQRDRVRMIEAEGGAWSFPGALKASGRVLARDARTWLIIETVWDRGTIAVERAARSNIGTTVTLPTSGRAYAPMRDLAIGPDGNLFFLNPQADGLHIVEVAP